LGEDGPAVVLAAANYDGDHFRDSITETGAMAVIPSNPSWIKKHPHDKQFYKESDLIECSFSKLKKFRRVATGWKRPPATSLPSPSLPLPSYG
jgi:transposase